MERIKGMYRTTLPIPKLADLARKGENPNYDMSVFQERMNDLAIGEAVNISNSEKVWRFGNTRRAHFPEESSGTNLLLYIQNPLNLSEITTLRDLTHPELYELSQILIAFLSLDDKNLAAWGTYYERKDLPTVKHAGQSITQFHAHLMSDFDNSFIAYDFQSAGQLPRKYRGERFAHQIEQVYQELWQQYRTLTTSNLEIATAQQKTDYLKKAGDYINRGGIFFTLPKNKDLAREIRKIDEWTQWSFRTLASIFFANTQEVITAMGSIYFEGKEQSEVLEHLETVRFSLQTKQFLRKITPYVIESDGPEAHPNNRPFRETGYTTSLINIDEENFGLLVTPHFYATHATSRTDLGLLRGEVITTSGSPGEIMPKNIRRSQALYDVLIAELMEQNNRKLQTIELS